MPPEHYYSPVHYIHEASATCHKDAFRVLVVIPAVGMVINTGHSSSRQGQFAQPINPSFDKTVPLQCSSVCSGLYTQR